MKGKIKKFSKNKMLLTIMYSFIFGVGLGLFMENANLISTGLAGVAQILTYVAADFHIALTFSVVYWIINIPGIIIGYVKIGTNFTNYSVVSILTVSIVMHFMPSFLLTNDILLNCFMGGIILGYSTGGLLKIGSSCGGTDFFGIYIFHKFGFKFSSVNLAINMIIILTSAWYFGTEIALYTLLSVCVRQLTFNYIYTNNHKLTVWIVGDDLSKVSCFINQKLGRGTSIFKEVEGGYSRENKEVLMTILNEYQYQELINCVYNINPNIFISVNKAYRVDGNFVFKKEVD